MSKKNLIKGTLILAAAGIIAKLLGFFFRIPLINMIGEEGIGLYQLTYPLYTFLLGLAAGIPVAISKMISERMALNRKREANKIFKSALFLMGIFGILASVCLLIFSKTIIYTFKWSYDAYYSLLGISLAPLFTCILSVYRGYFQGLQNMGPPATSQVIEQLARICSGVGLAYILLPKGIDASAGGASFGATAGAAAGLLWMLSKFRDNRISYQENESTSYFPSIFKEMLKLAIPISIGQAIGSIMALIDSIQVPGLLMSGGYSYQMATKLFGQLTGKAHVLVNVPLTLSMALAQSTVPAISEVNAVHSRANLNRKIQTSFKLALILALPCCAGLYTLARPVLSLVFQGMSEGWQLMQILSIAAFFIIIAQVSTSVLNGIGKTIIPVVIMAAGCLVKIVISRVFIPIPIFNIKAAAYSTLIAYALVALLDFLIVVKYTKVSFNIYDTFIGPALCSVVMTFSVVLIYVKLFNLTGSGGGSTLITIFAGAVIYFAMLIITRTLSMRDIRNVIKNRI